MEKFLALNRSVATRFRVESISQRIYQGSINRPAHEANQIEWAQHKRCLEMCDDYRLKTAGDESVSNLQNNFTHIDRMFPKNHLLVSIIKNYTLEDIQNAPLPVIENT